MGSEMFLSSCYSHCTEFNILLYHNRLPGIKKRRSARQQESRGNSQKEAGKMIENANEPLRELQATHTHTHKHKHIHKNTQYTMLKEHSSVSGDFTSFIVQSLFEKHQHQL